MKMINKCKWLVLLMALVMLSGTVSVTAFAEEQTPDGNYASVDLNEKNAAGAELQTVAADADKADADKADADKADADKADADKADADKNEEISAQSDSNAKVEQVQPQNDKSPITASNSDATSNTTISSEDSESSTSLTVTADADKNKETPAQSDSDAKVEPVQWDISKSKEATNLDGNFESSVTLSLPAGDYKGDLDVVFVLDGSTSTDAANLAESAAGLLDDLAQFKNLNVKAGVVIFGGSVTLLYNSGELVALTEDSLATLKGVLTDQKYDKEPGRSGSNLQAGVKAGQKLLNDDRNVADADKYLILLTDGGARMWVNEKGEAMSQGFRQNNAEGVSWGSHQDFASRYIEAGDESMPLRTFDEVWNAGSTDASFAKYAMTKTEADQTDAWKNAADWNTVLKGSAYYTSLEVSTYYAATSIIDAGQHAHVIWVDYPYHDGKNAEYTNYFKSWLDQKGYITRYESDGKEGEIFADVKDQLIYLLDAGSYVVDYMGYVAGDYNLDFINKAETLTLTVGGEKKTVVDLGNNAYGFGEKLDNDSYEYKLTYYPAEDDKEYFKWDINVPVTKDKPVKLTYKVKLVNPKTTPGTYGVYDKFGEQNDGSAGYSLYTNNKATLIPVDSKGEKGKPEDFKKPTVSYVVPSTPDTPDKPDVPSNPDTPTTPATPDTPDNPNVPSNPDTPATPDNPNVANNQDVAATSDEPAVPTDSVPQTGDASNVGFWLALMIISFAAFTGVCIYGRKRRYTGHHIQK